MIIQIGRYPHVFFCSGEEIEDDDDVMMILQENQREQKTPHSRNHNITTTAISLLPSPSSTLPLLQL